jgi:CTP:molybdopterin cytidylyltransferase MocA
MSAPADPAPLDARYQPVTARDPNAVGILLAAGAGRRMGRPKALVIDDDGEPWLARGVRVLQAGGCAHVIVVLGAEAGAARALLETRLSPHDVTVVEATDWQEGIGASLRAGLAAAATAAARFAVVSLVDLPHLRPDAVRRLAAGAAETTLRQATYVGRPGHPVVIGAAHVAALTASLSGDTGARPYLLAHGVEAIDCTDLGGGDDVDTPPLSAG